MSDGLPASAAGAAEARLRRTVALDPNDLLATGELTLLLFHAGRLAEAEVHARNAVRIAPDVAYAHNLMGMVLTEAGRPRGGEHHYSQVLALTGERDPILLANLAWNLKSQGRIAEARALYRESSAAAPRVLQTMLGFAKLEEADRALDAAEAILDEADAAFPGDVRLLMTRASLIGRRGRPEEALALIEGAAAAGGRLGPEDLLAKGRLLDRAGRHAEAWAAFAEGKRLARELSGQSYEAGAARQLAGRLAGFFTAERLRLLPRAGVRDDVPQPIFILGFPRSGTTLVEQTLSAHPRIGAGDELPAIHEVVELLPRAFASPLGYPEALAELWMGDRREGLDDLRDCYLRTARRLGAWRPGAARFTDKMPLNETHLGLIALMFPAAPLIHVLRHPLDVMVSVFSNAMTHGFFCAADLESAAAHYALVMGVAERCRAAMTMRYRTVRYEDLVRDQEAVVRGLLAFVGETYDSACLMPHENRRPARTASYAQVAEPLYDRSIGRWLNYRAFLEPVVPILAPICQRLGYDFA